MDSQWVMVIITGIYVIATIAIFIANHQSAKATKNQLLEMKRQYEEDNRPYIEVELHYVRKAFYIIRFVNHGRFTAQHVSINLDDSFISSLPEIDFKRGLEKQRGKECIIGVGQHYDLYIGSNKMRGNSNWSPVTGEINYQSNGKSYTSPLYIDLENYMTFFSSTTDHDDILKAINDNTKALYEIGNKLNQNAKQQTNKTDKACESQVIPNKFI